MKIKKILLALLILIFLVFLGFTVWGYTPAQPTSAALQALQSDSNVMVSTQTGFIEFLPKDTINSVSLIFYPGGRVDYRAYAETLHEIAAQGYPVYLVKMPLNLAVFGINKADQIINRFTQTSEWVIAGHSLGGAMAASYSANNLQKLDGLVLWAAYATQGADLSQTNLPVLSISASEDGLSTPADIEINSKYLPITTQWYVIKGGNHGQFGSYGLQNGDGKALISAEDQHEQIVTATVDFLKSLEP